MREYVETTADCLEALMLLESTASLAHKLLPSLLTRVAADISPDRRCLGDTLSEPVRNGWSPVCDNSAGGTAVLSWVRS